MLKEIFKAYDIRGTYPQQVDEDAAFAIGFGTATFLTKHPERPAGQAGEVVLVSRDMRTSSPALAKALSDGIGAAGMNVVDLGMCDTSMMYFAVNYFGCAGGIQTTASHNPPNYNGFKISAPLAKPVGGTTGLPEILTIAQTAGPLGSKEVTGSYRQEDIWDAYRKHILKFLTVPTKPVKVFIDGSNGMAGKLIPKVFGDVENLEVVDVNFEITGSFVHEPNPLVAENMIPTQQGVVAHQARFGACFDGDADRCMVTDELGNIIGCDILTAFLCGHFLSQDPGATVIYDLRSSKVVEETILKAGAKPQKGRVGHVFMKKILRETNGIFGGELSGHFYFRDNYFADSGAIAFAAIVSVLGQTDTPLSELISPFKKYPQSGEINFQTEDKDAVLAQLKDQYSQRGHFEQLDGVSFDLWDSEGFWFNVRASNTEPLLRLNAEAKDKATLDALLNELMPKLGKVAAGH